jgi:hypothetical protein
MTEACPASSRTRWQRCAHITDWTQGLNRLQDPAAYSPTAPSYSGPGATVPAAPGSFTATAANQVSFTWAKPTDGGATLTGYVIEYRPSDSGSFSPLATITDPTALSYVAASGLTQGNSYDFDIKATNAIGTGTASATPTATAGAVPVTYAADTFTRSTLGSTETGSYAWTKNVSGSTWTCNGSQLLTPTAVAGYEQDCYIDDTHSDGTIQATSAVVSSGSGVCFRVAGTSNVNGYIFWNASGTYTLSRRNGSNSYTALGTGAGITPAAGDVLKVVLNGSSIKCYVNGTLAVSVTDSTYAGTRHGLWVNSKNGGTFDNFSHTSVMT